MDTEESRPMRQDDSASNNYNAPKAAAAASVNDVIFVAESTNHSSMDLTESQETPHSEPDPSCIVDFASPSCSAAPLPCRPTTSATRSSETREVHHVTFAEPCNKYVHSDSGIVLSPDDSDLLNEVTGDGHFQLTDESDDDADEGHTQRPVCLPIVSGGVPGPPIIKLHRCHSTDSRDNPFLLDGELSRKADYIITHSTFLRSYVRVADPDQIPVESVKKQVELSRVKDGDDAADQPQGTEADSCVLRLDVVRVENSCPQENTPSPPQRTILNAETKVVGNGEAEEPLLLQPNRNNGNGLENSTNKQTRKKVICCTVQ